MLNVFHRLFHHYGTNFILSLMATLMATLMIAAGASSEVSSRAERAAAFDTVWNHINDNFYDARFGGHDWKKLGDRYREVALAAPSEKAFYIALNTMLFSLEVSHIGVIPDEHPEWIGAPAAFADGEVGLDIRVIDEEIVVVRRKPGLGDRVPEIQPGTILKRLNGLSLDDFMTEVQEPPVPAISLVMRATERAGRELFLDPGKSVEIVYLDNDGREQSLSMTAYGRGSAITLLEGVPPVYVDFETRVLSEDVGYIWFNSFHRALSEQILAAIVSHRHRAGLIIDVRGNVGGDFNVRRAMAEHLIGERAVVWRYSGRRGMDEIVLDPAPERYEGKVVFLVDELSASSAEELPGAMQALGRATVVGNVTAGMVLVADVLRLDIGASLVFPVAETSFVNGYVPEGKGVTPDVLVPYSLEALRSGRDGQLDAALKQLQLP